MSNNRYLASAHITPEADPDLYQWVHTIPKRQLARTVRTGLDIVRFLLTLPGAREYDRKGFLSEALKAGLIPLPPRGQVPAGSHVAAPGDALVVSTGRGDEDEGLVGAQIDDLLGIGRD